MRQRLVVDASISLAWSLNDETDHRADEALTIVEHSGALVPTLWTYEIANALTISFELADRRRSGSYDPLGVESA